MAYWMSASAGWAGVFVAIYVAWRGLRTFQRQKTVDDVRMALAIFDEINRYWDRVVDEVGNSQYNYGQILALFETASLLFNREILSDDAQDILGDHIIEVFTALKSSEDGGKLLQFCRSRSSTFAELEKFFRANHAKALLADAFEQRKSLS